MILFLIKILCIWIPILLLIYWNNISKRKKELIIFKNNLLNLCKLKDSEKITELRKNLESIEDAALLNKLKDIVLFTRESNIIKYFEKLPNDFFIIYFSFKEIKMENYFSQEEINFLIKENI